MSATKKIFRKCGCPSDFSRLVLTYPKCSLLLQIFALVALNPVTELAFVGSLFSQRTVSSPEKKHINEWSLVNKESLAQLGLCTVLGRRFYLYFSAPLVQTTSWKRSAKWFVPVNFAAHANMRGDLLLVREFTP